MISLGTMVQRIHGLLGTRDVNAWEEEFIGSVWQRTRGGVDTTTLTDAQAEKVEQLFDKNFAG